MAKLPSTGITVSFIRNFLGVLSTDVGALCASGKINCRSKFKPIKSDVVTIDQTTYDYRGSDGDCGISATVWSHSDFTGGNLMDKFDTITTWSHIKPQGGKNSPFRLGDFRQYDEDATAYQSNGYPDDIFYNTDYSALTFEMQCGAWATNTYSLQIDSLSMPDFMQRFELDYSILSGLTNDTIIGVWGVVIAFEYEYNNQTHDYAYLCSKLEYSTPPIGDVRGQIKVDLGTIPEGCISPLNAKNHKLRIATVLTNTDTNSSMVPIIAGSLPNVQVMFLDSSIVEAYREYDMKAKTTEVGYFTYSIYGQGSWTSTATTHSTWRCTADNSIIGITAVLNLTDGNAPSTLTMISDFPVGSAVYGQTYTLALQSTQGSMAYYSGYPSLNSSTLFPSGMVQGTGGRFTFELPAGWTNYYLSNNQLTIIKGF